MNISASAALQFRSVKAMMLRRIRLRFMGSRVGYIWVIVETLAWVFLLKLTFRHSGNQAPGVGTSYEVFFVTGVMIARAWRTGTSTTAGLISRGKRQTLPAVSRLDSAFAAWLLEMTTAFVVIVIALAGLALFGFDALPADALTCLAAYAAMALYTLGFSMTLAVVLIVAPGVAHFQSMMLMMLFFTSGFTFLVDRVPPQLRAIVVWNPLLHCVEWFRVGFYKGYQCASLDLEYLFTVTFILLLLGLAGERALRRRVTKGVMVAEEEDA